MSTQERRYRPHAELRVASADDPSKPTTITGYAVVYNSPSENLGGFTEIIKPGAFTEALKTADVRALIDHKPELIIGRTKSGTLRLYDEAIGLRVEIDIPKVSYALDLAESIRLGNIDGMSFGFIAIEEDWEMSNDRSVVAQRTILKAEIYDVSAVSYPAYPATTLGLRSLEAWNKIKVPDHTVENRRLILRFQEMMFK